MPSDGYTITVQAYSHSITVTREELVASIGPSGRCLCGAPAVVRYMGSGPSENGGRWTFCWPRCGTCHGCTYHNGSPIFARPMEPHHRRILRLLGDEDAFLAAVRLGYRPPAIDHDTGLVVSPDGAEVTLIDVTRWDDVF